MNDPLAAALRSLPHGPEFRFLDRLTDLDPGRSGAGEYRVRGDEPFLRGHFPGDPLLPGVLLVEAAAQLAGVVAQSDPGVAPLEGLRLTAIRGAKFSGPVRPGDTVRLRAELVSRLGDLVHARVEAWVEDRPVLRCEVSLGGTGRV